jgi:alanine racemase
VSLIRLSKSALFHNLSLLSDRVEKTKIAVVLKDNAYGHGLEQIASLCAEFGARYAVVRARSEAIEIAHLFEEIIVLADNPHINTPPNVSITLNSLDAIDQFSANMSAHIKVDSGMHRNGIEPKDIPNAIDRLIERGAKVRGVFSHLRSADRLSSELFWQEKNFNCIRAVVEKKCGQKNIELPKFHLYNSAALLRNKNADRYDLVRAGIALYGYCDLDIPFDKPPLKPVLSLWAQKIADRKLRVGDRVGYGGVFQTKSAMKAGIYDVGYGDGFLRLNGLEGYKTPSGKRVLGRVNMDSMAIEGDDDIVCVMNDAETLARLRGTISYEALVRLNANIKREIVE